MIMDAARFADLARSLAWQIGQLRAETWTAETEPGRTYGYLDGPGQARLSLTRLSREGKLRVAGLGPDGRAFRRWIVNVDPARGLLAIGRDINRRLIAAGYADDLLTALAKKAERDQADAEREGWLDQAAEVFGIERTARTRGPGEPEHRLYLDRFVRGSGYVESDGHRDDDTGHLTISLSGIPAQVALAMLKVLAESVSGSCCFTYGPGHPPQFAVTGCLYRADDTERGEDASRERVWRFLVKSRGISAGEAYRALDAAREHGAEVIEPDGAVQAVITWDHEGCGEYTVEVPRERAS